MSKNRKINVGVELTSFEVAEEESGKSIDRRTSLSDKDTDRA
jgi:hypothetical protein